MCHFRFSGFSKRQPLDHLFAQADAKKQSPLNDLGCPSTAPVCHETIVITVTLGPSGFLKVIFQMGIGSFSVLFVLCFMYHFITFAHKTFVNA